MKMDEYGPGFKGLMGIPVHELIDNSMYEVQGSYYTHHYYYYNCGDGYPEFKDNTGKSWWGIYEDSDGYIWCRDQYNSKRSLHFKNLEVVKNVKNS